MILLVQIILKNLNNQSNHKNLNNQVKMNLVNLKKIKIKKFIKEEDQAFTSHKIVKNNKKIQLKMKIVKRI